MKKIFSLLLSLLMVLVILPVAARAETAPVVLGDWTTSVAGLRFDQADVISSDSNFVYDAQGYITSSLYVGSAYEAFVCESAVVIEKRDLGAYETLTLSGALGGSARCPDEFAIQYKLGEGAWTDFDGNIVNVAINLATSATASDATAFSITLPAETDNAEAIEIRIVQKVGARASVSDPVPTTNAGSLRIWNLQLTGIGPEPLFCACVCTACITAGVCDGAACSETCGCDCHIETCPYCVDGAQTCPVCAQSEELQKETELGFVAPIVYTDELAVVKRGGIDCYQVDFAFYGLETDATGPYFSSFGMQANWDTSKVTAQGSKQNYLRIEALDDESGDIVWVASNVDAAYFSAEEGYLKLQYATTRVAKLESKVLFSIYFTKESVDALPDGEQIAITLGGTSMSLELIYDYGSRSSEGFINGNNRGKAASYDMLDGKMIVGARPTGDGECICDADICDCEICFPVTAEEVVLDCGCECEVCMAAEACDGTTCEEDCTCDCHENGEEVVLDCGCECEACLAAEACDGTACGEECDCDCHDTLDSDPEVNKLALEKAIQAANTFIKSDDFKKCSAQLQKIWQTTLENALAVYDNADATQAQVDEATAKLNALLAKTGESTVIYIVTGAMLLAIIGLAYVVIRKRKHKLN